MPLSFLRLATATSVVALCSFGAMAQVPIPRPTPAAGSIVAAKGGEELRFVREGDWRSAALKQDLISGDALRTNSIGNLAILFADQTQIRVGRNSTLVVNEVASSQGNTQLELQAGQVWARAARGGSGVDVKTPAAVAAIRGTDWSLAVDGSGKTSLIVLEGVVELKNAQGSVTVRQGEGGVAAIGQAPTKYVLVNSNDREQMLFYLTLRDVFTTLSASPLELDRTKVERARIEAIQPAARRTEDWLDLAEILLDIDTRKTAAAALAEAQARRMTQRQRARADFVGGLIAGAERRWSEAAALFARAERGLDPKRRARAAYGRYAAASLADPKRVQPEPEAPVLDVDIAEVRALITGFRQDLNAASKQAREAEKRFPRLARVSAELAMLLDRRDEVRAAYERAKAATPDDPSVLVLGASIKAEYDRDHEGALADLEKALAIRPTATIWNEIGSLQEARSAPVEAEAAYRRAIEMDPENLNAYSNLAILLLNQSRVDEAGSLIDHVLAVDPSDHSANTIRGRYLIQKGQAAGAIEAMLAGTAANPGYSIGLLMLADSYFQNGDEELAFQALDNAERLDPNSPNVAIFRTAFALDEYKADEAIAAAREAVRRSRARGGDFAALSSNQRSGSYPAQAYRFLGLHDVARFYADRTFDPFQAQGYFDQAVASRPGLLPTEPSLSSAEGTELNSSALNLSVQGLLLDPLAIAGRIGRYDPFRRPFLDSEITGGPVARGGEIGWQAGATVNGFTNAPLPTSFTLSVGGNEARGKLSSDEESGKSASIGIGVAPSAADRFMFLGWATKGKPGLLDFQGLDSNGEETRRDNTRRADSLFGVAGWSHTFGHRNVLSAAVFATRDNTLDQSEFWYNELFTAVYDVYRNKQRVDGAVGAVSHAIGIGDFNLRYGLEAQAGKLRFYNTRDIYSIDFDEYERYSEAGESPFRGGRAYADLSWRPTDWFEAQAAVHRTFLDTQFSAPEAWISPRFGIGVSPVEGQWLRAAYIENAESYLSYTLSPTTTVGLIANDFPASGPTKTVALRWDAEWSPRFFTAVEYQRQISRDLSVPIINTLDSFDDIDKARTQWVAATANLWLGHGIGVFGTVGGATSEVLSGRSPGEPVPLVPERFARAGMTFVHPSRFKFTLTQNFVGERSGFYNGDRLDSYWTTDAAMSWETPDRRLLVGLTVLNLFDTKYEFAFDVPASGRTVAATLAARF